MQQVEAVQGTGLVQGPLVSIVHPVLPSPFIREIMTDKTLPAKVGRKDPRTSGNASQQGSIPISPITGMQDTKKPECRPAPATKSHPVAFPITVRPRSASVSRRISKNYPFIEQDIPLYLVPHIIARAIWQRGERTFRISVIRTKQHYYTIRLRTARPPARTGNKTCTKSRSVKIKQDCPAKTK